MWNALNGCFDGNCGQVIGTYIFEYALVGSPDGSAYRAHNNCFCHVNISPFFLTLKECQYITIKFLLQRIPFFLNDNRGQYALQSNAVQQVVAYISAHTRQVFLYFTLAHAGHNHLIEVCAHT